MKLNLGCGDKILDGYMNVDTVSRMGKQPDMLCDLRKLDAFENEAADEILAVHVVEHFWRWEVRDVLHQWMRVLKPGARMILECPDLAEACRQYLAEPSVGEGRDGQRSLWVFYGDPRWRDPLMVHRWGYTPKSLGELMAEVGLREVKQEPAQFKLREPRDFRMVGIK